MSCTLGMRERVAADFSSVRISSDRSSAALRRSMPFCNEDNISNALFTQNPTRQWNLTFEVQQSYYRNNTCVLCNSDVYGMTYSSRLRCPFQYRTDWVQQATSAMKK